MEPGFLAELGDGDRLQAAIVAAGQHLVYGAPLPPQQPVISQLGSERWPGSSIPGNTKEAHGEACFAENHDGDGLPVRRHRR